MITWIKFIIKLLFILFLLFFIGLFILMIIINNVHYQPQIVSLIDHHTNYKIQIKGKVKYSIIPTISMYAEDIIITPKNDPKKLLEAKELHLIMDPLKYILAKIKGSKDNKILLKLDSTILSGVNTQINITSELNINFFPKLTIDGNIQLLPSSYKKNLATTPLKINITLNAKENSLSIDQQQVDAQLINQLLTPNILISGSSDIKAKLFFTNNQSNTSLLNNLSGNVNIVVNNGKLHGLDIFNILTYAEHQLNSLFDMLRGNIKQSIPSLLAHHQNLPAEIGDNYFSIFTKLTLEANFNKGITNNANISLQHPTYTVQGTGTIDLPKNIIDYKVNAHLNKINPEDQAQVMQYIKSTPIFIKVQGSLDKPNFTVNTEEYLNAGLKELQKSLITNIFNIRATVKEPVLENR